MNKPALIIILFFFQLGFSQEDAVFDAIRNKENKKITELIKDKPELINKKNGNGFTPLILASYYNNEKAVKILLQNKADVNIVSPMGTALMAATYKGNKNIVKLLLNYDANVNISDSKGTTPLHYACIFGNTDIAKLLINKKPDINVKDANGKTPLDYAVISDNIELIKLFNNE